MKGRFVLLLGVLAIFSTHAVAQITTPKTVPIIRGEGNVETSEDYTVGDVKGLINTKAVYLPKPVFPLEARYAGAEGPVRVQISIDEEGSVISARAIAGNTLLRPSAEDAARRSKFRMARDTSGAAVKTGGVLVYNFVIGKAGWSRIGYGLGLLDRLPVASFSIPMVAKSFAPEWTSERHLLEKLSEIGRADTMSGNGWPAASAPMPVFRKMPDRFPNGTVQESATMEHRLVLPPQPAGEQIAVAQDLILALKTRLGNDELSLWQFNLGLELGRVFELYRNPNEGGEAARRVKQFADSAPRGVPVELAKALRDLAAIFESGKTTIGTHDGIRKSINIILNSK